MDKTIKAISEKAGINPEVVELAINIFLEHLEKEVIKNKEFQITNFGKFVLKKRKGINGRISKRGKTNIKPIDVIIPDFNKIKFIASKRLKEKINPRGNDSA